MGIARRGLAIALWSIAILTAVPDRLGVAAGAKARTGPTAGPNAKKKLAAPASGARATSKGKTRSKTGASAARPAPVAPAAPAVPTRLTGKVAVFGFDGDGAVPLQARVVRLLRARGLKVITTLRPFDSAEQYRETASALDLVGFVDGEASEDGDQASVTVNVRSGISGLRVASATISGERRTLAGEVDRSLWGQLGMSLGRACTDADKPRNHVREPMRIEAGTPLDSPPAPRKDAGKDEPAAKAPAKGASAS